jgi:predicted AlkP superfamily pyrophosphatase or phosphodiesterase
VIVVSDHGFKAVKRNIRPNAVLKEAELADAANVIPEGGTAMAYTVGSAPLRSRLVTAFNGIEGIERVVEPKDYAAVGLPTPAENSQAPDLLLVAKDGYAFVGGNALPVVVDAPPGDGQHGYLNTDPEMDAIFIAWGRGIRPGAHADRIRNVDVAPTIAVLLGLQFSGVEGRPLADFLTSK